MVMLKFHERDDIFSLHLPKPEEKTDADITATVPGGYVEAGAYVRLIAPEFGGVDDIIKVIRANRQIDKDGDLSTIEGTFVR